MLVEGREQIVADRCEARVIVGERILTEPLQNDWMGFEDAVTLDPGKESGVDLEVLVRIAKHDDAGARGARWDRDSHYVSQDRRVAIAVPHREGSLTPC